MSVRRPLAYLVVFMVVTGALTALLTLSIAGYDPTRTTTYRAVFANASKVQSGDDVRVAGVSVGRVTGVHLTPDAKAEVTFTVARSIPLTSTSTVAVRYRNLIGERYLSVVVPAGGAPQRPADVIPQQRTQDALDLTEVFNGFRPLFQGLDPQSINALSLSLVQALQGEGGTLAQLLGSTGSLGSTIAAHDQQIGQLVTDLSSVLGEVNDRTAAFRGLVSNLQSFTAQLAQTRTQDLDALASIDQLAGATNTLLTDVQPGLAGSVQGIQAIAQQLADGKDLLAQKLQLLPTKLNAISRAAQYGSWFQFYDCGIGSSVVLPDGTKVGAPPNGPSTSICGAS